MGSLTQYTTSHAAWHRSQYVASPAVHLRLHPFGQLCSRPHTPTLDTHAQKKRIKGVPAETYRDRWLKRLPRKNMSSWLSGLCSACEMDSSMGKLVACVGPCMRSFHLE